MSMHPTAYLEHYADQYANNMLHRHGVTLDQYLADPARYEHLLHQPFPLMPEQTRVRVTLMRAEIQEKNRTGAAKLSGQERRGVHGAHAAPPLPQETRPPVRLPPGPKPISPSDVR